MINFLLADILKIYNQIDNTFIIFKQEVKIGTAYPVNEFQLFTSRAKFWLHAILIAVSYKIETG